MSTLMLSQQVGVEGGVPPAEAAVTLGEGVSTKQATAKATEQERAGVGCCGAGCSVEEISERATTITPLLAEILTHKSTPGLESLGEPGLPK